MITIVILIDDSLFQEHLFDVSDLQHEPPLISKCGSLEVTFQYDAKHASMSITVLQAREVPAKERGGTNHSQVRMLLLPTKKQRVKTKVRTGENPAFDETFVFSKIKKGESLPPSPNLPYSPSYPNLDFIMNSRILLTDPCMDASIYSVRNKLFLLIINGKVFSTFYFCALSVLQSGQHAVPQISKFAINMAELKMCIFYL